MHTKPHQRKDSQATRQALGHALKNELRTTPLDKVTVVRLTATSGVTRQTFYNHFADVYDLAIWVFETEIADHILANASLEKWADGFTQLLVYMRTNREQCMAVIRSLNARRLENFFYRTFREMMRAIVNEVQGDISLLPEDRAFVIDHYTVSVTGHLLHWLFTGMYEDPLVLVPRLKLILDGKVSESLKLFALN